MATKSPEAFLQPGAFPHPCTEIRLIETHISWIILTGPFAYKLRRPVDLGFVDFTSLEARREDCEREVELNRRFGSGIYVGVVPMRDPSGDIVDWAVKMHQFDQRQVLDQAVVTEAEMRDFGKHLATIHSELPLSLIHI